MTPQTRRDWHGYNLFRLRQLFVPKRMWFVDFPEPFGTHRTWLLFDEERALFVPVAMQDLLTTTNAANQTYTSNAAWNNALNTVQVIGGGGASARGASTTTGGGGGGGGAYNRVDGITFTTPGTTTATYRMNPAMTTGSTYPGTGLGDNWFNDTAFPTTGTNKVGAKGGVGPASITTATGGAGGLASAGYPTTSPPGRNGGTAANGASATAGGGGGGAGGPIGVGGNGSGTTGGTGNGGTETGGAAGNPGSSGTSGTEFDATHGCAPGAGASNASGGTGGTGGNYGGGAGGGSRSTGVAANGSQGIIVLTSLFSVFTNVSYSESQQILRVLMIGNEQ